MMLKWTNFEVFFKLYLGLISQICLFNPLITMTTIKKHNCLLGIVKIFQTTMMTNHSKFFPLSFQSFSSLSSIIHFFNSISHFPSLPSLLLSFFLFPFLKIRFVIRSLQKSSLELAPNFVILSFFLFLSLFPSLSPFLSPLFPPVWTAFTIV